LVRLRREQLPNQPLKIRCSNSQRRTIRLTLDQPSASDPLSEGGGDPLAEDSGSASFGDGKLVKPNVAAMPDLSPQSHLPHGGWMVDQRRMAIVYVPTGHSDPMIKSWLTAATTNATQNAENHFQAMLAPKAMGACTECHKLDQASSYNADEKYLWTHVRAILHNARSPV
jgi:hypothetical protein